MYVKLRKHINIRGWKNYPYALDDTQNSRRPVKITPEQKELLSKAFYYDEDNGFMRLLMDLGMLEECAADGKIADSQGYFHYGNLYFDNIIFSITGKCNYRCRHCSVGAPDAVMGEMTFGQITDFIRQFRECGLKNITLIGGEPLVHPDFMRIVDTILEYGLFVTSIYTNGSLINEKLLCGFAERNIRPVFQISFDGVGFHDKMRGVHGAEKRFFESLDILKKYHYSVSCYMSITKESISSLPQTVNELAEYGVSSLTVFPPFDCGNWASVSESEKLTFEELLEAYIRYIPEYIAQDFPLTLNLYRIAYFSSEKKKYMLIPKSSYKGKNMAECPACRTFEQELNISPEGILSPCYAIMGNEFIKSNMPDVLKVPLREALTDSNFTRFVELKTSDIFDANEKCGQCFHKSVCGGGCRASALIARGDFKAYDPAMCFTFENQFYDRLKDAVMLGCRERRFT